MTSLIIFAVLYADDREIMLEIMKDTTETERRTRANGGWIVLIRSTNKMTPATVNPAQAIIDNAKNQNFSLRNSSVLTMIFSNSLYGVWRWLLSSDGCSCFMSAPMMTRTDSAVNKIV